jgi:hypothetical protein
MARTNTQDAVIINMDDTSSKKEKKQETLFGPNIGVVGSTPQWAQSMGQKAPADNVSSNIIQNWISRSKEVSQASSDVLFYVLTHGQPSQPTTTLQALVNLKRPSLRLCPLTISSGDDSDQVDSHHNHGLEFEYDCDAAKCRINVSVVLPADHPYAETIDSTGYSCISIFESIVDGGFGKVLHLDEGATLELGRFEHKHTEAETASSQITGVPESSRAADIVNSSAPASSRNDRARKRFAGFNFRKRSANTSVSGPALAVVDAEASGPAVEGSEGKEGKEEVKDGVRVTIRLSALDEDGTDLSVVNEQITYLHVVRFGAAPDEDKEDTRPWVVEVVKREATVRFVCFYLALFYLMFHRLDLTHSTCTRFMVFPLSPPHPLNHRRLLPHRTHILTRPRLHLQRLCTMMNLHLSVYCAFLPHVRSFYSLAATSSHARNVLSTWSNSVQAVTSSTPKKPQPQSQAVRLRPQKL